MGVDPIVVGSEIILALQTVVARKPTDRMGFRRQFAWHQPYAAHIPFTSESEIPV
jgi:hypothetical protein